MDNLDELICAGNRLLTSLTKAGAISVQRKRRQRFCPLHRDFPTENFIEPRYVLAAMDDRFLLVTIAVIAIIGAVTLWLRAIGWL
jgi:hypothetical protein